MELSSAALLLFLTCANGIHLDTGVIDDVGVCQKAVTALEQEAPDSEMYELLLDHLVGEDA